MSDDSKIPLPNLEGGGAQVEAPLQAEPHSLVGGRSQLIRGGGYCLAVAADAPSAACHPLGHERMTGIGRSPRPHAVHDGGGIAAERLG